MYGYLLTVQERSSNDSKVLILVDNIKSDKQRAQMAASWKEYVPCYNYTYLDDDIEPNPYLYKVSSIKVHLEELDWTRGND